MRSPTVESVRLTGSEFIIFIVGGFLLTQLPTLTPGYDRQRLLIAGLIAVVLGGVSFYQLVDA